MLRTNLRSRNDLAAVVALFALAAAGCGGPSADDVRQRTSALLRPMIGETAEALDAAAEHPTIKMLLGGLDLGDIFSVDDAPQAGETEVPVAPPPPPGNDTDQGSEDAPMPPPEHPLPRPVPEEQPRKTLSEQADELAAELDDFLSRYVFSDDNVESSNGGKTTFVIRGEAVCGETDAMQGGGSVPRPVSSAGSGGAEAPASDSLRAQPAETDFPAYDNYEVDGSYERCVTRVNRLGLRIDATLVDDGVDLDLRVGAASGALCSIELRPGRLTVKAYLPAVAQAASDIATAVDEELPASFPATMQGTIAVTLKKVGDRLVAEVAVLDRIKIAGQSDGSAYGGELPAANPLLSVGYSTKDGAIDASVDWGATDILLPANAMFREQLTRSLDKPLKLLLSGVKARLKATAAGELKVEQLSVGKVSQLLFGSDVLAKLDANPDAGHALSMSVAPWQQDQDHVQCTLDPKLDVQLELKLSRLDGYVEDPAPPALANERYQLLIAAADGKLPTIVPLGAPDIGIGVSEKAPMPDPSSGSGGDPAMPMPTDPMPVPEQIDRALLRVLSGSLTLQSFVKPVKISVGAGQCLIDQATPSPDGEPESDQPLAGLAAGACE